MAAVGVGLTEAVGGLVAETVVANALQTDAAAAAADTGWVVEPVYDGVPEEQGEVP